MTSPIAGKLVLANSIRLILAMLHLADSLEQGFGRSILDILAKQYPEAKEEIAKERKMSANAIGNRMMSQAKRELQNDGQAAMDAIQDVLTYISTKGYDFRKQTQKGAPGAATWRQALNNVYSNIRSRAMSMSQRKYRKIAPTDEDQLGHLKWVKAESAKANSKFSWNDEDEKELKELEADMKEAGKDPAEVKPKKMERKGQRDKSTDEAFGKRGEDGGAAEGGEARIPSKGDNLMGKALDDKAAVKEFMDLMDEHVPMLKQELPVDQRALFSLIFDEETGGFGSDIKDNMNQATELKKKLENGGPEEKAIYEKNAKRWSGYVGDLRKKLLDSIWDYIDKHMTQDEYKVLKETFYGDTTPSDVRGLEKKKVQQKADYQRGIDLRKVLKARKEGKTTAKPYLNLVKKLETELKGEGKNLEEELKKAEKAGPSTDAEEGESQVASSVLAIAQRLSGRRVVAAWISASEYASISVDLTPTSNSGDANGVVTVTRETMEADTSIVGSVRLIGGRISNLSITSNSTDFDPQTSMSILEAAMEAYNDGARTMPLDNLIGAGL